MRRSLVLALLVVVLGFAAMQTGRRLLFNLTYLLGGTLVLSFIWAWSNAHFLALQRISATTRSQVGRMFEERFIVRNRGWLPKLWLEVRDDSTLPNHHVGRVVHSLMPRQARGWSVKTLCVQRGRFRLGPMELVTGDPFGLFTFTRAIPHTSALIVYPATFDLPTFEPPRGRLVGGEALYRRTHHITPNVAGVRDYQPGDSFNRIHWRSTARTGRLIVKEFEEDPTADVWLVVDMDATTVAVAQEYANFVKFHPSVWQPALPEPILPSSEEYVVTAAASIGRYFINQKRPVGLIAHAQERFILQPDRGPRQMRRLLEHLAVMHAEGRTPLHHLLALEDAFFTRGTTLIVCTASPSDTWVQALTLLRRRGTRPMAVVVDAHSFDPHRLSPDDVMTALQVAGIPAYRLQRGDDFATALGHRASVGERAKKAK